MFRAFIKSVIPAALRPAVRRGYRRASFWMHYYLGNRFVCPICDEAATELLFMGEDHPVLREQKVIGAGRRRAVCPGCNSSDRERLVYLFVSRKIAGSRRALRILHLAPEPNLSKAMQRMPQLHYVSADISAPSDVRMDLVHAPFREACFDVVICNHVLEHIPEDRTAMAEIFRMLKPGGWAVLQVPLSLALDHTLEDPRVINPEERARVFGQRDHVRIYARQDYRRRLEGAGFQVQVTTPREIAGKASLRFGLANDEDLYCAIKPRAASAQPVA